MGECDHVIGIGYFNYEGGGLHQVSHSDWLSLTEYDEYKPFSYCPLCGEKLPEGHNGPETTGDNE